MFATRNSLPTLAVVATLVAAGSTAAQAGGRFFPFPLCHGLGGFAGSSKAPASHKAANAKASDDDEPTPKRAQNRRPEPPAMVVQRPRRAAEPLVAVAPRPRPPAEPPTTVAPGAVTPAVAATNPCLTKEYLDTGAVMFRDVCTNEWAINSTDVKKSSAGRACLTKSADQSGIVMFKDTCTNEWAMNTSGQQSQPPQTR